MRDAGPGYGRQRHVGGAGAESGVRRQAADRTDHLRAHGEGFRYQVNITPVSSPYTSSGAIFELERASVAHSYAAVHLCIHPPTPCFEGLI